ncbi:DNA primase family protein [Jeotgalibacillus campisalis]|uniref:SF3 helicase domain-containing protein n=1 Tax=Jeotgalibacillus campisalis TaxID=220754 RepID=A0A0C2QXY2_9BACL|nr:phage/plasmid primase, P4 family [Jeotgalibacillus campisalis]KIL42905.1 hypothetical protein KR50_33080 [Jeotgalibacillus campisalis]
MVSLVKDYTNTVHSVLPGAKIIPCRGYINNKEYSKAKAPLGAYKDKPSLTSVEIDRHLEKGGWIGAVIAQNHIVIDIDNSIAASYLNRLLKGERVKFHLIKTPNGMQFIFKAETPENQKIKMISKWFTSIGIVIDTRVGTTNSLIVFPTENTKNRFISKIEDELDELPDYLRPIWNTATTKQYEFPIPLINGSRNQSIFDLGSNSKRYGMAPDKLIDQSLHLVYKYFMDDKEDFSVQELRKTIASINEFNLVNSVRTTYENIEHHQKTYSLTDLGNAKRLIDQYGDKIKYSHKQESWLLWDGSRWAYDFQERVLLFAQTISNEIRKDAMNIDDEKKQKAMFKFANDTENLARLKAMVNTARFQSEIVVDMDQLDKDPYLFNLSNGTFNLRTGRLQEHKKTDLISKKSNVNFDPSTKCEVWDKFLNKIMGEDRSMIDYLKRIIGYSLTGDTSEQKFFFLYGGGRNGKSTFLEVINHIIGEYADTTPMNTFIQQKQEGISNDIAGLKGSRFVTAQETEKGRQFAESKIKQLTGGGKIKARFLHKEFFEYNPQFKIVIAGNHKPIVKETKEAIWNRIRLIPFAIRIEDHERDPHLKEKLISEASGILNWIIEGCADWLENGLQCPTSVTSATENYREDMDVVKKFLDDCITFNPLAKEAFKNIHATYNAWAQENGEYEMSSKALGGNLKERGFKAKTIVGQRHYEGLTVRNDVYQSLMNSQHNNRTLVKQKTNYQLST